ncbi:hypothetical protein [Cupriavidus lacunae]|uniref:hypothetical protein n=1 Tax=Cupriavidus lacunae TaxID=2666307 RepID=UPI001ABFDFE8|nr:hypothetical protein [Cupriavidus lacunae]
MIRQLGWPESHAQRMARAVALLRTEFAQSLLIERLIEAGMSSSSFYQGGLRKPPAIHSGIPANVLLASGQRISDDA